MSILCADVRVTSITMEVLKNKKCGLSYIFIIILELATGNKLIRPYLCEDRSQLEGGNNRLSPNNLNDIFPVLQSRIYNASYETLLFKQAERTTNLIAYILSLLSSKSVIIIYEENEFTHLLDYHTKCYNSLIYIQAFFKHPGYDIKQEVWEIFRSVNAHTDLNFLIVGTNDLFISIMEIVQHTDKNLQQHGYFTNLHKWIFLDTSNNSCSNSLLTKIGPIANILCV